MVCIEVVKHGGERRGIMLRGGGEGGSRYGGRGEVRIRSGGGHRRGCGEGGIVGTMKRTCDRRS